MRFVYKNAQGVVSEFDLGKSWNEHGKYISGYDPKDGHYKDFLKFRVIEYIGDSERLLADPYPPPPEPIKKSQKPQEILFTGFPSVQKKHLQYKATEAGLHVVASVTVNLNYLCGGATAGRVKLHSARMQGCYILNEAGFFNLIHTGELPDYDMLSHVV